MIHVVGLGPGSPGLISRQVWDLLTNPKLTIVLRTEQHRSVAALQEAGVTFTSCDDLYGACEDFSALNEKIVERILATPGELVYAVPGNPWRGEETVEVLRKRAGEMRRKVIVLPGISKTEASWGVLGISPSQSTVVIDSWSDDTAFNPRCGLLFTEVDNRLHMSELKLRLLTIYPPEHPLVAGRVTGLSTDRRRVIPLADLDRQVFTHEHVVYVPPCASPHHLGVAIEEFTKLMDALQGDNGCPWDREQTHMSLRPYVIEEAYEVVEAIESGDAVALSEELGDLLLQVVFHAHIANREQQFDLVDCIKAICTKLVRRHPHVFGTVQVDGADEVLKNWQSIKRAEKSSRAGSSPLLDVPKALPALALASKLQQKARVEGFDWPSIEGAWDKLREELGELESAIAKGEQLAIVSELGDVLFSVVNVARFAKVEPETALRGAAERFRSRFDAVLRLAADEGLDTRHCGLHKLDELWERVKQAQN